MFVPLCIYWKRTEFEAVHTFILCIRANKRWYCVRNPLKSKGKHLQLTCTPTNNTHTLFILTENKPVRKWMCLCETLSLIPSLLTSLSRRLSLASSLLFKLRWADKQIKSVTSCLHEPDRKSISSAMLVSQSSNHTSTPWQPRWGWGAEVATWARISYLLTCSLLCRFLVNLLRQRSSGFTQKWKFHCP